MKSALSVGMLVCASFTCISQSVENAVAQLQGSKVVITYDIVKGYPADSYDVAVYSSYNSYSSPLNRVSGAAGAGIKEATGLRMEIDGSEFQGYKGELTFELRAVLKTALSITMNVDNLKVKRGKTVPITWRGGEKKSVTIRLLMDGNTVSSVENIPNSGSYSLPVSKKTSPGSGFQVKVECGDETAITNKPFKVKRKAPIFLIIAAPVVIFSAMMIITEGEPFG